MVNVRTHITCTHQTYVKRVRDCPLQCQLGSGDVPGGWSPEEGRLHPRRVGGRGTPYQAARHRLCTALSQQERRLLLGAVIRPPLPRDEQLHSLLCIARAWKAWSLVPARVCRAHSPATTASRWGVLGCPRTAVFSSFLVMP